MSNCELCTGRIRGKERKYCGFCRATYGRFIYNAWMRRAYQKRAGYDPEPLVLKNIHKRGNNRGKVKQYAQLRDEGKSYAEIGKVFGITKSAVHIALKRHASNPR